ncbi:MAG: hypothetical protein HDT39_01930 [Lachnospiraceae bacterium]|nr:hypothetical protein [Lachnospiraceae bacterium]
MKNLKRVFVLLLTAAFLLNYTNAYANTENSLYEDYIPEEAYNYAKENYRNGLGVILDNVDLYGISGKVDDFQLCDPYIVYDVEKEVQEPLYYFPIKNSQEKIVLVMAIFLTENGWSDSISGCMADELNDKRYLEEECLIYGDSDEICVENEENQPDIEKVDGAEIQKFTKKEFRNKKKEFKKKYKVDFNVKLTESNDEDSMVQSGFIISTGTNILIDSKDYAENQKIKGKQKYICWAASVATIYNYVKDKHITAKNVCDNIGHSYAEGTYKTVLRAFEEHELDYVKVDSTLDYDRIRSNLKGRKPISMWTRASNNNSHLVTLVGIDLGERNQPRITIWNSATEQYECMAYLGDDTAYGMGSSTYYWQHSYCFYYK